MNSTLTICSSDYSYSAQPNMLSSSASGIFSFCQTGPADLSGSAWDTTVEGPQNFPEFTDATDYYAGEAEDSFLPFGQITPKPDQDDFHARWAPSDNKALKAEPMRRGTSRSSTGSLKNRNTKPSATSVKKTRSRVQSILTQTSSQMSKLDMAGAPYSDGPAVAAGRIMDVQQYLAQDLDTLSVSGAGYYPMMGFPDGLTYSNDLAPMAQHVNPQIFDAGLISHSPHSWGSLSPVDSRLSSPGLGDGAEDLWSAVPSASSPGESQSSNSPVLPGQSPRYVATTNAVELGALSHTSDFRMSRKMDGQYVTSDDLHLVPAMGEDAFALPPAFGARRMSGEGESARDHYLYKNAYPHADGLFHCPWEGQPSCNHKPEKLKCNYDKFVDSHLKPYRCKVEGCQNARFSSTACLLRHEREAHAMHGHGEKPYLCTYEGCERSVAGHGFPRQWNLRDHMRRVHNDNGTTAQAASPPASGATTSTRGRKRKSDVQEKPAQEKTSSRKSKSEASKPVEPPVNLEITQWWEHQRALQDLVSAGYQPDDIQTFHYIKEAQDHLTAMDRITHNLTAKPEVRRGWRN
ncbi:uncharacterized protein PODANS_7_6190 [Podospora anserina S mat+]|uniref:Podospora anserina S mat+ genomic DNA chromosome 7, supercontig 1 n=3 Tax=Podospora TaxID=5144 RepID=B2AW74_PODAN|nr:uncharacterized protein PODANS_7_6190 [Podospora anserina S mat+]KAK4639210.1 hypothetical protein QC761_706190 [Podospora bellae-mahoneyi]CAP68648.1 unnamed protein product [Podospora anserina S mat+]CDP32121.1 Putative protein of unknown function [Podospora anserina S mat+]VBB86596.1 Putative protein of unknown function [Podospora comata]